MLHASVLAVVIAAAPATPMKVATPSFTGLQLSDKEGEYYAELFSQRLGSEPGFSVVTSRDIATLLGMERQRQLLNCSDSSSSCLVELANALGADAVAIGSLGTFGKVFVLDVKLVRASDAQALARYSEKVRAAEDLPDAFASAAHSIAAQVRSAPPRPPETNATATNATATNATATNATGTNATGTNATGTNATGTNAAGTNATGTNATATNVAATNVAATNVAATNTTATNTTATNATAPAVTSSAASSSSQPAWIPIAVGVPVAGAGVYFIAQTQSWHRQLVQHEVPLDTAQQYLRDGPGQQALGWSLLGVGVAAIGGGVAWWLAPGSAPKTDATPTVSVAVSPGGAFVGASGVFR